jgi:ATP-binding cassette subfamily B protein
MFALRAEGELSGIAAFVNSPYSVIIIIAVIFINAGAGMWISKNGTEQTNAAWQDLANTNRLWSYYGQSVHDFTGAMDIRIYKQSPIILKEQKKWTENATYILLNEKIAFKFGSMRTLLNSVVNIIIYGYVGIKAFTGAFGIGLFLQYTGSVGRFVSGVSDLIGNIARLRHNNVYLKDVLDYINMPNDMYQGTLPVEKRRDGEYEIALKNVSFKYPGPPAACPRLSGRPAGARQAGTGRHAGVRSKKLVDETAPWSKTCGCRHEWER